MFSHKMAEKKRKIKSLFIGVLFTPSSEHIRLSIWCVHTKNFSSPIIQREETRKFYFCIVWSSSIVCYFEFMMKMIYYNSLYVLPNDSKLKLRKLKSAFIQQVVFVFFQNNCLINIQCLKRKVNELHEERMWDLNWFMWNWFRDIPIKCLQTQTNLVIYAFIIYSVAFIWCSKCISPCNSYIIINCVIELLSNT